MNKVHKKILARATRANQVCSNLNVMWNDKLIILGCKLRLMNYLLTYIFRYACETWTLTAELETRIKHLR